MYLQPNDSTQNKIHFRTTKMFRPPYKMYGTRKQKPKNNYYETANGSRNFIIGSRMVMTAFC